MAEPTVASLCTNDPAHSAIFKASLSDPRALGRLFFIHHEMRVICDAVQTEVADEPVKGMAAAIWEGFDEILRNLWICQAMSSRMVRTDRENWLLTDKSSDLSKFHQEKARKAYDEYERALAGGPSVESTMTSVATPFLPDTNSSHEANAYAVVPGDSVSVSHEQTNSNSAADDERPRNELAAIRGAANETAADAPNTTKSKPTPSPNNWMNFDQSGKDLFLYHVLAVIREDLEDDSADDLAQSIALAMWHELHRKDRQFWAAHTALLSKNKSTRDKVLAIHGESQESRHYRVTLIKLLAERNDGELKYLQPEYEKMQRSEIRKQRKAAANGGHFQNDHQRFQSSGGQGSMYEQSHSDEWSKSYGQSRFNGYSSSNSHAYSKGYSNGRSNAKGQSRSDGQSLSWGRPSLDGRNGQNGSTNDWRSKSGGQSFGSNESQPVQDGPHSNSQPMSWAQRVRQQ